MAVLSAMLKHLRCLCLPLSVVIASVLLEILLKVLIKSNTNPCAVSPGHFRSGIVVALGHVQEVVVVHSSVLIVDLGLRSCRSNQILGAALHVKRADEPLLLVRIF